MKLHNILKIIVTVAVIFAMTAPASAEIMNIDPMSSAYLQSKLTKDSTISYTWYCDDTLDFYIADSAGNKYMVYNDVQGLTGEFTVPYDSTWYIMWSNDNVMLPVTLTYDVSTSIPSPSISMIYIIAIAIIAALILRRKR